jgi:transposase-like protein
VVSNKMDALEWLRKQLDSDGDDVVGEMVREFAQRLMAAEVDAVTGAGWGEVSPERVNHGNGYRTRPFDTRVGSIEVAIPKLRRGSYFPEWLLDPRRRAEKALVAVVAECYVRGVSTRRVDGLVKTLGIESLSKSQVSRMAGELDEVVTEFRNRPLDAGPYTYVWMDALTQKVREGGRIINVAVVIAVGVNRDGHREILGLDVITTEDGAGWLAFLLGLVARGLAGTSLVISDAHPGLVDAIASTLTGAGWQRCRTHYMRNLLTRVPKSAQSMVATPGAHDLRAARCRVGVGPARPRRRPAHRTVPCRRRASRRCRHRRVGLHRVPQGALAPNLVEQPPGTAQQGTPPPHRRCRDLPEP